MTTRKGILLDVSDMSDEEAAEALIEFFDREAPLPDEAEEPKEPEAPETD